MWKTKMIGNKSWIRSTKKWGVEGMYPAEVIDCKHFLIEQRIPGIEYAVDAFFKADGTPEIVNIYEHEFSSNTDVSDRVYIASKAVFERSHDKFMEVLRKISVLGKFRNFAMHIEFRITPEGVAIPIEANPTRFAGFCLADMTQHACRFNPYEAFFFNQVPDWSKTFKGKEKTRFALVIGNLPPIDPLAIESIDYEKFKNDFSTLMELHHIDYVKYHVFAVAFSRIEPENNAEIEHFLTSDMKKYLEMKK